MDGRDEWRVVFGFEVEAVEDTLLVAGVVFET